MTISNVTAGALIDPAWGNSVADEINARGRKALASKTSTQASITSAVDISSLTVTWTATASRLYRLSVVGSGLGVGDSSIMIARFTDASSNPKYLFVPPVLNTTFGITFAFHYFETGLSGSITRKIRAERGNGSGSVQWLAGVAQESYLCVEDIGAA